MPIVQQPVSSPRLFILNHPREAATPCAWQFHRRFGLLTGGQKISLAEGVWLLERGVNRVAISEGTKTEYLYQCADGVLVALPAPLAASEVTQITDPQAITAMSAYRSFNEAAEEDWGTTLEPVTTLPIFNLIKCPFCWSQEFYSISLASVRCNQCQAVFVIAEKSGGDPGFIVRAYPENYVWWRARFFLPPGRSLYLSLAFSSGGDPRDLTHYPHEKYRLPGCSPEQPLLTDEKDKVMRAGLHACYTTQVSGWRLAGLVPSTAEYKNDRTTHHQWDIDGRKWPACAYVQVSGLSMEEKRILRSLVSSTSGGTADLLKDLITRPHLNPIVSYFFAWSSMLPDPSLLHKNESYMLYRWLIFKDPECHNDFVAYPIWYVVKPVYSDDPPGSRVVEEWEVIRRNFCPKCAQPVKDKDMKTHARLAIQAGPLPDSLPHRSCRRVWELGNWQPYLDALEKNIDGGTARTATTPES